MTSETQFRNATRADEINLLRDQILEIYQSTRTFISDDGARADKVSPLKKEYNQLSNELESLKQASTMDPLALLPPEVWTEIIRETTKENGDNLLPTDTLLPLTLVSREWGRKILGTPGLWTNVNVGRGEADAQVKLASVLHLIKDLEFENNDCGPSMSMGRRLVPPTNPRAAIEKDHVSILGTGSLHLR